MVANQLVSLLPSGEARAVAVAQRLGMSTRSFTRQLAKEGTTFGEILERLRRRLASRYLARDGRGTRPRASKVQQPSARERSPDDLRYFTSARQPIAGTYDRRHAVSVSTRAAIKPAE
jgi:AraC-like DNA-binding protein